MPNAPFPRFALGARSLKTDWAFRYAMGRILRTDPAYGAGWFKHVAHGGLRYPWNAVKPVGDAHEPVLMMAIDPWAFRIIPRLRRRVAFPASARKAHR